MDGSVLDQRIVEAAAVLPDYGGVTGWAQLCWAGGTWFDGVSADGRSLLPVTLVTCGCDVRPQRGIAVSAERLNPADLTTLDGLRTTTSVRSVVFEMRYARTLVAAITVVDMAAYSDLVSLDEVAEYVRRHPGWTGIPQAREALAHADENTWSPRETRLRFVWTVAAGLPRPLTNVPVFDLDGRHIGTPDILDVEAATAGEYEGVLHLQGRRRSRDLEREDAFRRVGLESFSMVAADDTPTLVDRMTETRERGLRIPPDRRLWTVRKPPWWISTETVVQRRGLSEDQRRRLLRRRTA